MKTGATDPLILRFIIALLALADGVLHLALDWILFGGNLIGALEIPPRPPPGAPGAAAPPPGPTPPELPLQLNQLFLLDFIGYVVFALVFWFGARWLGRWRWLLDLLMIVYVIGAIVGWLAYGKPNPMGLGYLSKAIEVLLILALLAHAWMVRGRRGVVAAAA